MDLTYLHLHANDHHFLDKALGSRSTFILTHHMLTQLQTCKLFHPASLNLDTVQVLQPILLQEDPAITRMSSKWLLSLCLYTHTQWRTRRRTTSNEETEDVDNNGKSSNEGWHINTIVLYSTWASTQKHVGKLTNISGFKKKKGRFTESLWSLKCYINQLVTKHFWSLLFPKPKSKSKQSCTVIVA